MTETDNVCMACQNKMSSTRRRTALDGCVSQFDLPVSGSEQDVRQFLQANRDEIDSTLEQAIMDAGTSIKSYLTVRLRFYRETEVGTQTTDGAFQTNVTTNFPMDLDDAANQLTSSIENFNSNGSNWLIDSIEGISLTTAAFKPLSGSSFLESPDFIKSKKCCVNLKNPPGDERCFLYCIIAFLHPNIQHKNKIFRLLPYIHELNVSGITFPVQLKDIPRFENLNPSISVSVFTIAEKNEIVPLYITNSPRENHVRLLLLTNSTGNRHYILIKKLSALIAHRTKHQHQSYICDRCIHPFSKKIYYDEHLPMCSKYKPTKINLPSGKHTTLKFRGIEKLHVVPFVIYCDFEAFLKPMQDVGNGTSIRKCESHIPSGFASLTVCSQDDSMTSPVYCYSGENVISNFLNYILHEKKRIDSILKKTVSIKISDEEEREFLAATNCHVCKSVFDDDIPAKKRCRHHLHFNGKYLFPVCSTCNLHLKPRTTKDKDCFIVPIFFHNLARYDAHFIIEGLKRGILKSDNDIKIIPTNTEQFLSFEFSGLRFLDSYKFLCASLETLVDNLKNSNGKFTHTLNNFNTDIILRKNVYMYEYMDGIERFFETSLPPKSAFYSSLCEKEISNDDYSFAQYVFSYFKCRTLKDYHDLYLKSDVTLLADVFENFRELSLKIYEIDAANYYTLPALAFDAMLKYTDVELQLITDISMYLFMESAIRGGVATINHREAHANNKYIKSYDPSKETSFIIYFDATNLYGWSQMQYLPTGDFKWVPKENFDEILSHLTSLDENADTGYIFEVDISYPSKLHDLHSPFPLAPEKVQVPFDDLSSYCKTFPGPYRTTEKLIPNLSNKSHYVTHYRNLQLYIELGMEVTKTYRILQFRQSQWMRPYIELNTRLRQESTSTFDKGFFKLMNNSVFGEYNNYSNLLPVKVRSF